MTDFFDLRLFLGFPLDSEFETDLKKVNPHLLALFISGELYLHKVSHQNSPYLGKFSSKVSTLSDLEQLQLNVMSLLQKLAPNRHFAPNTLQLLAVNER